MSVECEHTSQIRKINPSADGCEDCLKTGDGWVHLRLLRQLAEQTRDKAFLLD
jgi:hypothetical protein